MRVLIEGAELVNKGAEAMLRTAQAEMAARFEGARFLIESRSVRPGTHEQTTELGFRVLNAHLPGRRHRARYLIGKAVKQPGKVADLWRDHKVHMPWDVVLDEVDIILDASGLRYSDDRSLETTRRLVPFMEQARNRGKPFILLPQSFGPFRPGGEQAALCKRGLGAAALLFARDRESRQHVATLLGRDLEQIPLAPDIAFNFKSAGPEEGRRLLDELGLGEGGKPIVALSPNMRVYERTEGFGAANTYVATMVRVAKLFARQGVDVLLVPHEVKRYLRDADDRMLCELIRLAASIGLDGSVGRVAAATQPLGSAQFKAMIGHCELLIGSRFHALIAALQSRRPVVALGWSHKYVELLRDVGLEQYVVGHNDIDADAVTSMVETAWRERQSNRLVLEEKLPPIEAASAAVFDLIHERFGAPAGPASPIQPAMGVGGRAPADRPAAV